MAANPLNFLLTGLQYSCCSLLSYFQTLFSTSKTSSCITGSSAKRVDFGFAFNDKDFSDRVLRLQITPKKSESLHISTPILAANSPFFYKLFKNQMKESAQKDVTLMINSTEELGALMDVLRFMYKNTLKATKYFELLPVLMAADKFEVISCMEYCIQTLLKLRISPDLAVVYIDLPPSLLTSEIVQPLIVASKKVLAAEYRNFAESQEKAMELPLSAIEVVLTTDGLRVNSEDDVFDFVMRWGCAHYPNKKERKETLTKHLWPLVNFQYMSCLKLKKLLVSTNVEPHLVSDALMAKEESAYGEHLHASKGGGLARRAYIFPLVKVVRLDSPRPSCVVYLYLRRDECASLFPSKPIISQSFVFGGQSFFLMLQPKLEEPHCLGLFLNGSLNVDFEFAVMSKSSNDFQNKCTAKNKQLGGLTWGWPDLLKLPWAKFMSNDNDHFINDILHLRVKITLNNSH